MLAPIGKHSQTKCDALRKRQPVQIAEQWRNVVVLTYLLHVHGRTCDESARVLLVNAVNVLTFQQN